MTSSDWLIWTECHLISLALVIGSPVITYYQVSCSQPSKANFTFAILHIPNKIIIKNNAAPATKHQFCLKGYYPTNQWVSDWSSIFKVVTSHADHYYYHYYLLLLLLSLFLFGHPSNCLIWSQSLRMRVTAIWQHLVSQVLPHDWVSSKVDFAIKEWFWFATFWPIWPLQP